MKKLLIFVFLIAGFGLFSIAQPGIYNKVSILSGDLKFLKGVTNLMIVYNYDDMRVGDMTEEAYIVKKIAEMNKVKAGTGDEWKRKWIQDRMDRFEPNFEKKFKPRMIKAGITADQGQTEAEYTLIVKTIKTEPGLYTGVSFVEKNTFIDVYLTFVETRNPETELCTVYARQITGEASSFANYDIGLRISVAYYNCGNIAGAYIVKALKKIK